MGLGKQSKTLYKLQIQMISNHLRNGRNGLFQRSPKLLRKLQNLSLLQIHRSFIFSGDLEYPFINQLSGVNFIKI